MLLPNAGYINELAMIHGWLTCDRFIKKIWHKFYLPRSVISFLVKNSSKILFFPKLL